MGSCLSDQDQAFTMAFRLRSDQPHLVFFDVLFLVCSFLNRVHTVSLQGLGLAYAASYYPVWFNVCAGKVG